jgi:hypothetical protein
MIKSGCKAKDTILKIVGNVVTMGSVYLYNCLTPCKECWCSKDNELREIYFEDECPSSS